MVMLFHGVLVGTGNLHRLCRVQSIVSQQGFQPLVKSRGPRVRETIVEHQQRARIGAGQARGPNQSSQ